MKGKLKEILLLFISLLLFVAACKKDVEIPEYRGESAGISFSVPEGWPAPYYSFTNNKLTNSGFALGRKLFYDVRLSRDNSTSCGTCHQAFAAFANADHALSHGVDSKLGVRNSPPLFNLNWNTSFMWDGGINHIEVQPLAPITNPIEMDETMAAVLAKISNDPDYRRMYQDAFGSAEVNTERTFKAMAQFMGAMVSSNSKYDRYMRKENGASLNSSELAGMAIFENKCATCHPAPLFTDHSFRNVGVKPSNLNDSGRAHITFNPDDLYKFRVPSLRNLSYTQPYLHDGRYATLDEVLDQMEKEVTEAPNLDPAMKGGIKLTVQERTDLKAFLKTLDDETFVKDKRFFEPAP